LFAPSGGLKDVNGECAGFSGILSRLSSVKIPEQIARLVLTLHDSEIASSPRMVTVSQKLFQQMRFIPGIILEIGFPPHVVALNPTGMVDCVFPQPSVPLTVTE
jgi:hypothetical protein